MLQPVLVRRINNAFVRMDEVEWSEGSRDHDYMLPIVADAEAGFGGTLNAFELAKSFIVAGAAGVHYQDGADEALVALDAMRSHGTTRAVASFNQRSALSTSSLASSHCRTFLRSPAATFNVLDAFAAGAVAARVCPTRDDVAR